MSLYKLSIQNMQFGEPTEHLNKMPFSGVVAYVDTPTDGSPCGANGMKVVFAREAVVQALQTFIGMGVNCVYDEGAFADPAQCLTGHDERFKIGVVESAELIGNEIHVKGFLWCYDFSDVAFMIRNNKESLGFSVEVVATDVEEKDGFLVVNKVVFTGVAIMYRNLAAFKSTRLAAQRSDKDVMNEEQIRTLFAELFEAAVNAKVEEITAAARQEVEGLQAANEQLSTQVQELGDKLNAAEEAINGLKEAAPVVNEEQVNELKAENEGLKEAVDGLKVELAEIKEAGKQKEQPQRKSMNFSVLNRFEAGEKDAVLKQINEDKNLTLGERIAAKLELARQKSE